MMMPDADFCPSGWAGDEYAEALQEKFNLINFAGADPSTLSLVEIVGEPWPEETQMSNQQRLLLQTDAPGDAVDEAAAEDAGGR